MRPDAKLKRWTNHSPGRVSLSGRRREGDGLVEDLRVDGVDTPLPVGQFPTPADLPAAPVDGGYHRHHAGESSDNREADPEATGLADGIQPATGDI
jgi:hypothetical protein